MIIFITGGKSQGKTEYASAYKEQGYQVIDDICETVRERVLVLLEEASNKEDKAPLISHADHIAAEIMSELEESCKGCDRVILIGTEMGCGIVPVKKSERLLREVNGRLNCMLASRADKVILLTCGIVQMIKGSMD